MRHFVLSLVVGLAVSGCGSEAGGFGTGGSSNDAGTGGAGGSLTTTGSGGTGGIAGAGGGTGGAEGGTGGAGGALTCDAIGTCGNTGEGCVKCAVEGACAEPYMACFESADCGKYSTCVMQCGADDACIGVCDAQLPDGKVLFDAYQGCVLCGECVMSCAGAAACPASP